MLDYFILIYRRIDRVYIPLEISFALEGYVLYKGKLHKRILITSQYMFVCLFVLALMGMPVRTINSTTDAQV